MKQPSDIDVRRVQAMLSHLDSAENLIKVARTSLNAELGTVNMNLASRTMCDLADDIEIAKSMLIGFDRDSII